MHIVFDSHRRVVGKPPVSTWRVRSVVTRRRSPRPRSRPESRRFSAHGKGLGGGWGDKKHTRGLGGLGIFHRTRARFCSKVMSPIFSQSVNLIHFCFSYFTDDFRQKYKAYFVVLRTFFFNNSDIFYTWRTKKKKKMKYLNLRYLLYYYLDSFFWFSSPRLH